MSSVQPDRNLRVASAPGEPRDGIGASPRRRRAVVAVLVAAGLTALAVTGGVAVLRATGGDTGTVENGGDVLVFPEGNDFGISLPSTVANQPYTIGAIPLCLDDEERVVIESVVADRGGGLDVRAFAVRRGEPGFGAGQISLQEAGFGNDREVREKCAEGVAAELGVEFAKSTSATARTDGLDVHWRAGDRRGTTHVPLHLVLCEGADQDAPGCRALS